MKRIIILFSLFLVLTFQGFGQNSRLDSIKTSKDYGVALELYNQGKYEAAKKILISQHISYSTEFDQNWFILLAQTYIEMKNYEEANKELVNLLKCSPNYIPPPNIYQDDFYANLRLIAVQPKLSIGVKAARTYPLFSTEKTYSVYDSTAYDTPYKMLKGYCYSLYLQHNFNANFALTLDYSYSKFGYKRTLTRSGVDNFELKYSEIIYNNEIGISLKKYLLKDNSKLLLGWVGPILHKGSGPYFSIGGYYSKMRQAQANAEVNYIYTNRSFQSTEPKNLTRNNIDVKDMRNTKRFGLSAALGSSLTIDRLVISLEAKYLYDLTSLTNPEKRYNNTELLYNYYYIDNDVSVSRIDVSLSLAYILSYKVKSKLK